MKVKLGLNYCFSNKLTKKSKKKVKWNKIPKKGRKMKSNKFLNSQIGDLTDNELEVRLKFLKQELVKSKIDKNVVSLLNNKEQLISSEYKVERERDFADICINTIKNVSKKDEVNILKEY